MAKDGRAKQQEDYEDTQVKIKLENALRQLEEAKADPDLFELQRRKKRLDIEAEIARKEKEVEDIRKPEPPPTPPSPGLSEAEIRARKIQTLEARKKTVIENIRVTKADETLEEDLKEAYRWRIPELNTFLAAFFAACSVFAMPRLDLFAVWAIVVVMVNVPMRRRVLGRVGIEGRYFCHDAILSELHDNASPSALLRQSDCCLLLSQIDIKLDFLWGRPQLLARY